MGAANKLKELFGKRPSSRDEKSEKGKKENCLKKKKDQKQTLNTEQKAQKDKAEVEYLRKVIQERLKKDPKLSKKAAQLIEQMLNKNPPKR